MYVKRQFQHLKIPHELINNSVVKALNRAGYVHNTMLSIGKTWVSSHDSYSPGFYYNVEELFINKPLEVRTSISRKREVLMTWLKGPVPFKILRYDTILL